MSNGAGEYDDLCMNVRERAEARGVLLAVIGGEGFSFVGDPMLACSVPAVLEEVARQIRHPSDHAGEFSSGESGKYDDLCSYTRDLVGGVGGVVLIVFEGALGTGFSFQGDAVSLAVVPSALENMARQIRRQTSRRQVRQAGRRWSRRKN